MTVCPYCKRKDTVAKQGVFGYCFACRREFSIEPVPLTLLTLEDLEGPTPRPLKLFISYPHSSKEICRSILAALEKRGHEVWFDENQLVLPHGMDWRDRIARGIEESTAVLSCLSEDAVNRRKDGSRGVCLDELSIAVSVKGGNIKTVLLEPEYKVRPDASLLHRQWIDMSAWQKEKSRGRASYQRWFDEKMLEILRMLENDDTYEFTGEIATIRKKLQQFDFQIGKEELLNRAFIGRGWLARRVDDWIENPAGGQICFITGDPGIGKSAFAVQYAFYRPQVAASVFFKYGHESYNTLKAMVHAVAYQLACRLPDYRHQLIETLERLSLSNLSDRELLDQLIIKPFGVRHIDGEHETLILLIDGLDECELQARREIAASIQECRERLPRFLRLLISCRKDHEITDRLRPDLWIPMQAGTKENLEDIGAFLMERLKRRIPDEKGCRDVSNAILRRSDGIFLYAQVMAEEIESGAFDPSDMEAFPNSLNAVFFHWFERFAPDTIAYIQQYRPALGALIASPVPLPAEELERLFDLSGPERCDLIRRLRVLMNQGRDMFGKTTYYFSHKYMRDWLSHADAGVYQVFPADSVKSMGRNIAALARANKRLSGYEILYGESFVVEYEMEEELETLRRSESYRASLSAIGAWCESEGRTDTALQCYAYKWKAMEVDGQPEDAEKAVEYVRLCNRMIPLLQSKGRFDDGFLICKKALRLFREQEHIRGEARLICEISYLLGQMGGLCEARGDLQQAILHYREGLACCQTCPDKDGNLDYQRAMLSLYAGQARLMRKLSHYDEAWAMLRLALELCETIITQSNDANARLVLGNLCYEGALMMELFSRFDEARTLAGKGLANQEELARQKNNPENQRALSMSVSFAAAMESMLEKYRGMRLLLRYTKEARETAYGGAMSGDQRERFLHDVRERVLAEIRARYAECYQQFRRSEEIMGELVRKYGLADDALSLAGNMCQCAEILMTQARYDEAMKQYGSALAIYEKLASERSARGDWYSLATCLNRMGRGWAMQGCNEEAIACVVRAAAIRMRLAKDMPTLDDLHDYAISQSKLAGLKESQGKLEEAQTDYEVCLARLEQIVGERGLPGDYRDLSLCCLRLACLLWRQDKREQADQLADRSLSIAEELMTVRDIQDERWTMRPRIGTEEIKRAAQGYDSELIRQHDQGRSLEEENRLIEAQIQYMECLEATRRRFVAAADANAAFLLALLACDTARIKERYGHYDEALALCDEGIKALTGKEAMLDRLNLHALACVHDRIAGIRLAFKDMDGACEHLQAALAIWESPSFSEDAYASICRFMMCGNLARLLYQIGNTDEALTMLERGNAEAEEAIKRRGISEELRGFATNHSLASRLYFAKGNLEAAMATTNKAISLYTRLLSTEPDNTGDRGACGTLYQQKGEIQQKKGDRTMAKMAFKQALDYYEEMMLNNGSPNDFRDYMIVSLRLAAIESHEGGTDKKRRICERALKIANYLTASEGTLESLWDYFIYAIG